MFIGERYLLRSYFLEHSTVVTVVGRGWTMTPEEKTSTSAWNILFGALIQKGEHTNLSAFKHIWPSIFKIDRQKNKKNKL